MKAWYGIAKKAKWKNLAELKQVYPSADLVGGVVVFNIKGDKYRLVAGINFRSQTIFVKHVMTHKQYDLGKWK